jgi:hypothetical protein
MKHLPPYILIALCGLFSVTVGLLTSLADEAPLDPVVETAELTATPTVTPTWTPTMTLEPVLEQPVVVPTVELSVEAEGVQPAPDVAAAVAPQTNRASDDDGENDDDHSGENGHGHEQGHGSRGNGSGGIKTTPQATLTLTLPPPAVTPTVVATLQTQVVIPTVVLTVTPQVGVAPVVVVGSAAVTGWVTLPQEDSYAGITLVLMLPDGTASRVQTDASGNFAFTGLLPGAYRIDASLGGFLGAYLSFALVDGQQLMLPSVALAAGDTNGDNHIDLLDAALVASNLDHAADLIPQADLNHDGRVDVRDLTLIGVQFGKIGPLNWS